MIRSSIAAAGILRDVLVATVVVVAVPDVKGRRVFHAVVRVEVLDVPDRVSAQK